MPAARTNLGYDCGGYYEHHADSLCVEVNANFLQGPSVFDAQQIYTVHQVKLFKRLGKLPPDQFALIEEAAKKWLGLS